MAALGAAAVIARESFVSFHHFDLDAQALSKIERGHAQDLADVEAVTGSRRQT